MLKKLLTVTLIGLTSSFAHAEDKKVTGEMLIGKWDCKQNEVSITKYDSNGKVISETTDRFSSDIFTFKKIDEKIAEYINDTKFTDFKSDEATKSIVNNITNKTQVTGVIDRNYISDNEYQYIVNIKFKQIDGNPKKDVYAKATCTRIK